MNCPHCQSVQTKALSKRTDLGYAVFHCRDCCRRFNERTGTPFNFLEMPTDIVFQVVLFRLLFKLSLRDLVQMFLIRGYEFSYETVRDWEARFAPLLADQVRRRRHGRVAAGMRMKRISRWVVGGAICIVPSTGTGNSWIQG